MTPARRNSTDVLGFLLLWALVSLFAFSPAVPGDTLGSLLAGVLVTLVVIAALTVRRTDDLLFGLSRTPRGPTVAEQRLRGAFRRQSRPDTPGRPRPRSSLREPASRSTGCGPAPPPNTTDSYWRPPSARFLST